MHTCSHVLINCVMNLIGLSGDSDHGSPGSEARGSDSDSEILHPPLFF